MELKFYDSNLWGFSVYKTKTGTLVVKLEDGYYILSDSSDIDSDPCSKLKSDEIIIVENFN